MTTTSNYTQAPATKLVATHCAICGRPLVCAESLRTGIGPVCAEKVGLQQALRGTVECDIANELIYQIAANQKNWNMVASLLNNLRAVPTFGNSENMEKIIKAIETRLMPKEFTVEISLSPSGMLKIVAPYKAESVASFRTIQGRKFGKETINGKEVSFNFVPVAEKRSLLALLKNHYTGAFAKGPKGIFQIS